MKYKYLYQVERLKYRIVIGKGVVICTRDYRWHILWLKRGSNGKDENLNCSPIVYPLLPLSIVLISFYHSVGDARWFNSLIDFREKQLGYPRLPEFWVKRVSVYCESHYDRKRWMKIATRYDFHLNWAIINLPKEVVMNLTGNIVGCDINYITVQVNSLYDSFSPTISTYKLLLSIYLR